MRVYLLDIKQVLDCFYDRTENKKLIYLIDIVRDKNYYDYFVELISDGNGMKWLVHRAIDENIKKLDFIYDIIIDKLDMLIEKIGE